MLEDFLLSDDVPMSAINMTGKTAKLYLLPTTSDKHLQKQAKIELFCKVASIFYWREAAAFTFGSDCLLCWTALE